jgi:hypothetical protein
MSRANQLQTLYGWTPNSRLVFRKPVPTDCKTFKVPQTTGTSGWIIFTYENAIPVCLWMTAQECRRIPCIVDERICGDTFLRAEKMGPYEFVISDIFMFNSNCVFACSTFEQRYHWLKDLMDTFIYPTKFTAQLIHKKDLNKTHRVRGYEEHPDEPGKHGYFVDSDDRQEITKLPIPDCYEVAAGGYLKVPDLKTSVFLRSKGSSFKLKCSKNDDGSWTVLENIPSID